MNGHAVAVAVTQCVGFTWNLPLATALLMTVLILSPANAAGARYSR
jgi:hypothetical protein